MKINLFIVLLIATFLALLLMACTTGVTETTELLIPPSPEELAENHFDLPEIPRILCEQLKQMMDSSDDFVLVDARTNASFRRGYIPGAINIPEDDSSPPFTQEWVNDQLKTFPTNRMTILYCD